MSNTNKLLEIIQQSGPVTKKALQKKTGLTLTTLNRMLTPLFDNRWIYKTDEKSTTGGRPSNSIDIDRSCYAVIGIDISRTYIKVVLTTLKMDEIDKITIQLKDKQTRDYTLTQITDTIDSLIKKHQSYTVLSIGIGSVGPVDIHKGLLRKPSYIQIEDWDQVPIKDHLENVFEKPVYLNTGANMALLAESFFVDYKTQFNAAYINCGVGIRNSTMINGSIVATLNDREDTLGHTSVDSSGMSCYCGSVDCIDLRSSIRGILDRYKAETGYQIPMANYPDFFDGSTESVNTEIKNKIIKDGAEALGKGISNYIKLFNLNQVVIGGPLINKSTFFYNQVVKFTLDHLGDAFNSNVELVKGGHYQADSIAIGSAIYASQIFIKNIDLKNFEV